MKNYNPSEIEPKWPHYAKATRGKQNNSYNPQVIEKEWQTIWEKTGLNKTDLKGAKKPFYNLMMYPYPSAEGLHVGNVYAFTGVDIYGRFKKMKGWDVFEPIGFDSGGIHSENYAIKVGVHPKIQVPKNVAHFSKQLHQIGCMYDWNHTVDVMDPNYYKWTQWIFVQLFKAGLAYKKKAAVTWCPSCKTTLSDEQTEKQQAASNKRQATSNKQQGISDKQQAASSKKLELEACNLELETIAVCERCKTPVKKKNLNQWFFKITDYAERLLKNTEKLDWTEKVLIAQRNWIGKSEGVEIDFKIENKVGKDLGKVRIFTTAHDTIFGTTFMVLAPEHPLINQITTKDNKDAVDTYIKKVLIKSEQERKVEEKVKTGIFTGSYAINPFNNERAPIYVADYVLMGYGTGAVMGVPGHDARDHQFAEKYNLAIKPVIKPVKAVLKETSVGEEGFWNYEEIKSRFGNKSLVFDSGLMNGLCSDKAKEKLENEIERRGIGKRKTTYKLRDWCISRQRYWGPPIPMIYCSKCAKEGKSWYDTQEAKELQVTSYKLQAKKTCNLQLANCNSTASAAGWYPVPEDQLPVLLPDTDDYLPGEAGGKAPLARLPGFVKTKCPKCKGVAKRETDVSDTFLDSSWYFLAYPNTGTEEYKGLIASEAKQSPEIATVRRNVGPRNDKITPLNKEITKKWLPVAQYTGGVEHSVLHLLYSRFITMALHDLGYLEFEEPFPHFYAHGMIIKDGAKMSKSRGNIVNPDEYIDRFGADALRCYLMFLGPFNQGGDFRDTGMIGMYKFLARIYRFCQEKLKIKNEKLKINEYLSKEEAYWINKTIKKVGDDIAGFKYNTAIAAIMEYVNFLAESAKSAENAENAPSVKAIKSLILVLAPFAPHMAEELWLQINNLKLLNSKTLKLSVHFQQWPRYDPKLCKEEQIVIVVQVNGKVRDKITVNSGQGRVKAEIEKLALKSQKIKKYLKGKTIRKTIFISGKLVNFVA